MPPRITLIHWNAAEAAERAGLLRGWGYEVEVKTNLAGPDMRVYRESQPEAFVIDLTRVPSRGRDIGVLLRQQKATRHVPLVFAGGEPEKVERTRALLPDAAFAAWDELYPALESALAAPPADPVVRGVFDSYAGTPLWSKLGIRAGSLVALIDAPEGFSALLDPLPEGARITTAPVEPVQVLVLFSRSQAVLTERFSEAAGCLAAGGRLWIAWPKKTSGQRTDLSQNEVRAFGLAAGWMDYKISALDPTWSALCFTRQKPKDLSRHEVSND